MGNETSSAADKSRRVSNDSNIENNRIKRTKKISTNCGEKQLFVSDRLTKRLLFSAVYYSIYGEYSD